MRRSTLLLALVTTGGCVPSAPRPAVSIVPPATIVPPPPRPARVTDWRDWPMAPGDWTYRRDRYGTTAAFGPAGGGALVTLRCDLADRRLLLSRAGTSDAPFTIRTSTTIRQLPTVATGGAAPQVTAAMAAADPLLDAMAFSRGRFTIEQPNMAPLVLPAWAEIGRVIEDCRE